MLAATLGPWSEALYDAARMLTFAAAAFGAYLAFQDRDRQRHWIFMLGGLVLLYAPLMRGVLDRAPWRLIDVGAAIVIAAAPFYCKLQKSSRTGIEMTPSEAIRHADRTIWPA